MNVVLRVFSVFCLKQCCGSEIIISDPDSDPALALISGPDMDPALALISDPDLDPQHWLEAGNFCYGQVHPTDQ
jgi:hypothetical protein